MEMIAMLNGLGAAPRTAMDYLDQGLSRTISSNRYAGVSQGLGYAPMSPEQAAMSARYGIIANRQYSTMLGAAPVSARDYAFESGMGNVTSGAAYKNYSGLGAGFGEMMKSPWVVAGGFLLAFAAVGYLLKRK